MSAEQYELPGEWWTAPADAENGNLIMVTGRDDVDTFRNNPRFTTLYTITWSYHAGASGMPDDADAETMQQVTEALARELKKDPVAVMTGIFTGDGQRNWVFYTLSPHILTRKLNEVTAHLPLLPLELSAESDPDWAAYDEMAQLRPE